MRAPERVTSGRPEVVESETASRLEALLDVTRTGEWSWDFASGRITWSDGLGPLHGMPRGWAPASLEEFRALIETQDWPSLLEAAERARDTGTGYELEFRVVHPDGSLRWLWTRAEVPPGGLELVGVTTDVTERRRRDDAERFLARASQLLLTSPPGEALRRLCEVAVDELADWSLVQRVRGGRPAEIIALAHRHQPLLEICRGLHENDLSQDGGPDPRVDVIASKVPAVTRLFDVGEELIVPVHSSDEVEALLVLGHLSSSRQLDDQDAQLGAALARRVSLALERSRLFAAERSSRLRAEALQLATARFSAAATPEDVLRVAIEDGVATIGASGGAIAHPDSHTEGMRRVTAGYDAADAAGRWVTVPLDADLPGPQAARTGSSLWLQGRAEAEQAFPLLREVFANTPWTSLCAVPLPVGAERGFFVAFFDQPQAFAPADREFIQAIVTLCSQALERAQLLASARATSQRLARLQTVTASLGAATTVQEVAAVVVEQGLALVNGESAALVLGAQDGTFEVVSSAGFEPGARAGSTRLAADEELLPAQVFRTGRPHWSEPHGGNSETCVPLLTGSEVIGVFLIRFDGTRNVSEGDRELLMTLATQAAQAVANARTFERDHRIAEELQRALLPKALSVPEDVVVAVGYLPGSSEADVGGDWYDLVTRSDGRVGGGVGDVAGKGVLAASRMGELRNAHRAQIIAGRSPAEVVAHLDALVDVSDSFFATVVAFELDPASRELRYCCAGHLPPIRLSRGSCTILDGGRGVPLGVGGHVRPAEATEHVSPGDLVLFYTDGLVERPGVSVDEGVEALAAHIAGSLDPDPQAIVDDLLSIVTQRPLRDDIAVLAVKLR